MARPREFDEARALEAAIRCFWIRGYEATSVRDLAQAMGITGASLYNAYGDKRALFGRALDHYIQNGFCERSARLEQQLPPREAVLAFFDEIIERSLSDPEHKGCFIVNAALEVAPHDPEFKALLAKVQEGMEDFFLRCIRAGQAQGSIDAAQSADDLARLCLGVLMGLRVLARSRPERALLEGLVRPLFALLK
ncbi:TetR/AcrR family transcriptional regulator [Pseudomonas gingeri NCPPB 3146 = LMG 5327]|uniref:TetR/AcrR family transcriptional regulator n=2 Tax=Pseudomonas gingeri TaxID=117681 RepID=A0A7Y8CGR1_9PSED|nr:MULTISPECIES: TetR/AcrR family transcriptional regulator [Pseudomonas]NWC18490.1 TetR/AcrR family transcriptional regulator [Pseudomonas gingeri]NWE47009.1 TetR/AcrR family transcriptional regulator [Pseudomonas gingeri]NWE73177.1 TetR/AcrR family transcriptional regulator [Pseudomonas gingeri]PNQ88212.1 TetR/AcrR family transcriptional regulator [Pseudomonas gingeri NCPPB 3146 = LMG 5327]BBP78693.1 TetR family transcriptional regulator [Pseudomonas sp. Ost2]